MNGLWVGQLVGPSYCLQQQHLREFAPRPCNPPAARIRQLISCPMCFLPFHCAEDAMDGGCIIPCALEEWFRPVLQNNKFSNPDKLKFRYSAH